MGPTYVYIDGFNFYYGCIKNSPYRWLDLFRFAKAMLPRNEVVRVKYFTALVKSRLPGTPLHEGLTAAL